MWKTLSSPFHKVTGAWRTVKIKILALFSQGSTIQCQHCLLHSIQSLTDKEIFDTLPPELPQQPFQAEFAGP